MHKKRRVGSDKRRTDSDRKLMVSLTSVWTIESVLGIGRIIGRIGPSKLESL